MCSPVPLNIRLSPRSAHFTPSAWPRGADTCACAPGAFLPWRGRGRPHRGRLLLNRAMKYANSCCAVLLPRRKMLMNFIPVFCYHPMSSTCQWGGTIFVPSIFGNQDSSSSHSVSVICLMNEFGNLDKLPSISDCPSAKWKGHWNLPHSNIVVRNK